jgi:5-methylcytosine-specific restriction endonuclease McrA
LKKTPKWTKETVAAEIQRLAVDGVINSTGRQALNANARRVFGTWGAACEAAGVVTMVVAREKRRVDVCAVPGCDAATRSPLAQHCEKHYYRLRRTGSINTQCDMSVHDECVYCNAILLGAGDLKFCSSRCAARYYRKAPREKTCPLCSKTFIARGRAVTCSLSCRQLLRPLRRKQWEERKRATDPGWFLRRAQHLDKRKAKKQATKEGPIDYRKLIGIDEGRCSLCCQPIRFDVRWPHPLSLSIDHVIPLAVGGKHAESNMRIAHLRCNQSKNDKVNGKRANLPRKRQQEAMEAKASNSGTISNGTAC